MFRKGLIGEKMKMTIENNDLYYVALLCACFNKGVVCGKYFGINGYLSREAEYNKDDCTYIDWK